MDQEIDLKQENPFIGPKPFERSGKFRLYGRDDDAYELFYMVLAHRLMLFYAQSGAGKSSLVNAKLIPDLEADGFEVFPVARVGGPNLYTQENEVNPFTYYLMLSILQEFKIPDDVIQKLNTQNTNTLVNFFNCLGLQQQQAFDLNRFLTVQNQEADTDPSTISQAGGAPTCGANQPTRPRVLIIDQFEEILTTNLQHWKNRTEFFKQLRVLVENDPAMRVVLVVREEYVAGIGPYTQAIAGGIRDRFYMQMLDEKSAGEAIYNPTTSNRLSFTHAAADKLVNLLCRVSIPGTDQTYAGEFINPVQLQIVCQRLWEEARNVGKGSIDETDITATKIENAFLFFYDGIIETITKIANIPEEMIRDWFEKKLFNPDGTRNIVRQDPDHTAGLPNDIVKILVDKYIIRTVYHSDKGILFELAHDRLIQPILTANQNWKNAFPDKNILPKHVSDNLHLLTQTRRGRQEWTERIMKIPILIHKPQIELKDPKLGFQEITVRLEACMNDGPSSSRFQVVDFDTDKNTLTEPVHWDKEVGWFCTPPPENQWLPYALEEKTMSDEYFKEIKQKLISNPYYHQLNVWALAQRVLEFFEDPRALGRPVPWAFSGNRLKIIPHAGNAQNAYYDRGSHSLYFYYFGNPENPTYTCLSQDIVAHETAQAIFDGIRPLCWENSSMQNVAFFTFVGDLTAILMSLFNPDVRQFVSVTTEGHLAEAHILANIASDFSEAALGKPYLRSAINQLTMVDLKNSSSSYDLSQVLTGAMFEILICIATKYLENRIRSQLTSSSPGDNPAARTGKQTGSIPPDALEWAVKRFRRIAIQPLDLCPPSDIQFIDYAKAVLRNDFLNDPVDDWDFRQIMLNIFHKRKLCACDYQPGKDLPVDCQFQEVMQFDRTSLILNDMERVSRSHTAAYYFLNDNRRNLLIPHHQDFQVVDLYDNHKHSMNFKRLSRQIIIEYVWQEEVLLANDSERGLSFGLAAGKTYSLRCGGTLVFDERGNLLSWARKPGTEHLNPEEEREILSKRRFTRWDLLALNDLEEGRKRKLNFLTYLASLVHQGWI